MLMHCFLPINNPMFSEGRWDVHWSRQYQSRFVRFPPGSTEWYDTFVVRVSKYVHVGVQATLCVRE